MLPQRRKTLVPVLELGTKAAPMGSPAPPHQSQEWGSAAKLQVAFLLTPPCFLSQVQN